ncbi:MAG: GntR family transcriptional regulator [Treponema sp.]|jgi:DNA-binding LacI/PurR family transcriptional regulator|nr:GntR family transcriptional regulator [Treponema sp.]
MKNQPFYRHVYEFLMESIQTGKLSPGDRLPSEKDLCNQFGISRITSKRALELLAEQGYVSRFPGKGSFVTKEPSKPDRQINNSRIIGYVVSDFSDNFGTRLLFAIETACDELGYSLILKRSRDSVTEEAAAINSLINLGVDGLLILPVHGEHYNEEILRLILAKKPTAFVDRKMRGLSAPSFSTDNIAAARTGAEYLLDLGHRNIAFFSGPIKNTSTIEDRRHGFIDAYAAKGFPINEDFFCNDLLSLWTNPYYEKNSVRRDIERVKAHLSAWSEISAAFVAEYNMALIVKAAAEELGRKIPEDFSILTFDSPPSIAGTPLFTHLLQDEETIGRKAVETLHAMISAPSSGLPPAEDVMFPAILAPGLSTRENLIPLPNA